MEFNHYSVLLDEVIQNLNIKPEGIYIDGTLGGGGHSSKILEKLTTGKLIGIDQDEDALRAATERLKDYPGFIPVRDNFSNIKNILVNLGIDAIDGVILDLGVSSYQLDEYERGFSYRMDAKLDMRMDKRSDLDAHYIVNNYSEDELNRIFRDYGEEKWARRIAKFIIERRQEKNIDTTLELVDIIYKAIPKNARKEGGHPAKRVFQAIRIEVNNELGILHKSILDYVDILKKDGIIAIITFHSLEDRIVKNTFKELATDCICPSEIPVCVCDHRAKLKIITRKPILPSKNELSENSRSKSAKLRVGKRL